jgi:toxin ParE1/3/4
MSVRIFARAVLDIDDRAEQFGQAGPEVARRFLDAVARTLTSIEQMPGLGSSLELQAPGLQDLRCWPVRKFRKYLIIYRIREGIVEVLRVLHGARNIPNLLEGG